jgi:two-component system, OmpR family, sensor histidine kinase BaeS
MLIYMKSIFWRLLTAFIFIIIVSILISTSIEYITSKSQLPHLLTEIRSQTIAQILSSSYTRDKEWGNLQQEISRLDKDDYTESPVNISMRIVVKDISGNTLYNSFSNLVQLGSFPLIEGESVHILDLDKSEIIGTVTIYISREFLELETTRFLYSLIKPRIIQGIISIIILIFAAVLLSRAITIPIIALTRATKNISETGETSLIPVKTSDELGQMTYSFNQMILSLETQKQLRENLIRDLSHEINTPLSVIRLEAKGLNNKLVSPEKASGQIIKEVDKLNNLLNDLDWLVESASGEIKLDLETCSPGLLIQSEVERWQLKAEMENISLELSVLPPGLPEMTIDAVRMSQVLGNLIENGLKYSPAGSRLTVECHEENNEVVFSVCDNGPGIAAEDIPLIFERLYRGEKSGEMIKEGRGLGLSIVKQIVEMHQGRVRVESIDRKGSCFFIYLPN